MEYAWYFLIIIAVIAGILVGVGTGIRIAGTRERRMRRRGQRAAKKHNRTKTKKIKRHGRLDSNARKGKTEKVLKKNTPGKERVKKEPEYVSLKDRMIDKDDTYVKFNCMANGEDEQDHVSSARQRQDIAYLQRRLRGK